MQGQAKTREHKTTGPIGANARNRAPPIRPRLQPGLIQRAAALGKKDDVFEREAETVAARIANRTGPPDPISVATPAPLPVATAPTGVIQRLTETDSEGERPGEYLIQPAREGGFTDDPQPRPGFFRRLSELLLGGQPLPEAVRTEMEAEIGEPFGDVRIHTGSEAGALATEIGARAFTMGRDVVFRDGAYQPGSTSGRHLLAHELTHVVQQRGPTGESAVTQTAPASVQPDISDYIPDVPSPSAYVMSKIREYAPRLAPIVEKGPFDWLTEELGGVFGGVVEKVKALDPGKHVDTLVETFGAIVETASEIIASLVKGDCEPMMSALGRMKAMVMEIAGKAWDKVSEFFAPVGEFFSELWNSVSAAGSAAIDWIKEFAGDIWETVEGIGSYIWDKTEVIRDYGLGAWEWLTEKLFGPSEASAGDSSQGIISWFSDKAMEAWNWVKDKTRPVWEPVNEAAETVKELIPPDFVADLGEKMTSFADDIESTADELDQGNSVAENREALTGILPSLDEVIGTVRGVIEGAGKFLTTAITTVSGKIATFMTRLRSNDVVSWLAGALTWLETAIDGVAGWVTDKVGTLFEWYLKAFDFLSPFVKKMIEIVKQVVDIALDVLLLPKLLLTKAWEAIPECIRDPIKDFVINTVLAQIPVFNQLLKLGNLWAKVQETALQILRSIFVDGDIAKAAWTFFREMLGLIGLPIKLVVAILSKAARAYGMILKNPIGFLINLLKAMKEGFTLFFDNILTHLMNGVVGWLTGAVTSAGLTFPTELSFKAVLEFVLQLLDITVERVLARLEKKIGKEKVDKIRQALEFAEGVWEFVRVIVAEGITGLWRFIQEKLSNLWSMVLQSTIGWIVEKIITEATIKLLSFLDPSGIMAVINSCIAIYRAIETFVEQLKAMLQIVSKVLDGVIGIAQGAIEAAAGFLEKAMADGLPVAIAFLADQVGLGGLSDRIREFVEAVREKVDSAIDWLIDKALKLGKGFLQLIESGVDLAKAGVAKITEWWRARTSFKTESGESHEIFIEGEGRNATVILKSTPVKYADFLKPKSKFNLDSDAKRSAYTGAVTISDELDQAIVDAAASPQAADPASDTAGAADNGPKIQALVNKLGIQTAIFMPGSAKNDAPSSAPIYGNRFVQKYGTSASVSRLTKKIPTSGSAASAKSPEWTTLVSRARTPGSRGSYYVRGHLLNQKLGGPGEQWENLTTLTQDANNSSTDSHEKKFESKVKKRVLEDIPSRSVNFVCTVNYGRAANPSLAKDFEDQRTPHAQTFNAETAKAIGRIIRAEVNVPLSMDCSAHEIDENGAPVKQLVKYRVPNDVDNDETDYDIKDGSDPLPQIEIESVTHAEIMAIKGVGKVTADKFIAARTARTARITTKHILKNLSLNGDAVFSVNQFKNFEKTYRVKYK